ELLPFDAIEFIDDGKAIRFEIGSAIWKCDLNSYACSRVEANQTRPANESRTERRPADNERSSQRRRSRREEEDDPVRPATSPDGKWTAFIKDNNVFMRPSPAGDEIQLSQDGKKDLAYGHIQWSPDSKLVVAFRIEPGDEKEVYLIESSPKGGGRAK